MFLIKNVRNEECKVNATWIVFSKILEIVFCQKTLFINQYFNKYLIEIYILFILTYTNMGGLFSKGGGGSGEVRTVI